MRASIQDPQKIKYYMEIVAWSPSPSVFNPKDSTRKFETDVAALPDGRFQVRFRRRVPALEGVMVVRVYTLQFKAAVSLKQGENPYTFTFAMPKVLNIHDPRRAVRISLAPHITKMVALKKIEGNLDAVAKKRLQAIILDISANGISFKLPRPDRYFRPGRMVHITYNWLGITVDTDVEVVSCSVDVVRCYKGNLDKDLQQKLNQKITSNLDGLIKKHHSELKNLTEAAEHLRRLEREKKSNRFQNTRQLDEQFVEIINPCFESALAVFEGFANLTLTRREVKLERICSAIYDVSSQLAFTGPNINGNMFLCMKKDVGVAIAKRVLGDRYKDENEVDELCDVTGELTNMILGNSKKNMPSDRLFRIGTPTIIICKEHMVAVLSQFPVIRMIFDSEVGRIDVNLYLTEIENSISSDLLPPPANFKYNENLIEPILGATENIFTHFLALETRKKGVVMREKIAPKFELSAMLDIFCKGLRGKVLLNVSNRLAFKIHHILLMGEEKIEIDDEVKDAMGEMLNIIAGNAKAEFNKMDLRYQVTPPYVVHGRNHIISNAGANPFISSVYWTNEGFFEICLCFTVEHSVGKKV